EIGGLMALPTQEEVRAMSFRELTKRVRNEIDAGIASQAALRDLLNELEAKLRMPLPRTATVPFPPRPIIPDPPKHESYALESLPALKEALHQMGERHRAIVLQTLRAHKLLSDIKRLKASSLKHKVERLREIVAAGGTGEG